MKSILLRSDFVHSVTHSAHDSVNHSVSHSVAIPWPFRGHSVAVFLAALLLGPLVAAEQTGGPSAVIQGRVIAGDTGLPLRGASVQLVSEDTVRTGAARRIDTDARGRFEIAGLAAGAYRLIASPPDDKPMYLATDRLGAGPTAIIELAADETRRDVDFALPRAGAIGGRVSDQFGQPVAGAAVHVFGRGTGGRLLSVPSAFSATVSDDHGRYRAWGLPAGAYYVRVEPRSPAERATASREGYVRTYYPGSTSLSEATAVRIRTSEDLDNVDVRLELHRTFQVSGLVLDTLGDIAAGTDVTLDFAGERAVGTGQRQVADGDGNFTFAGLVPAEYELRATGPDDTPPARGALAAAPAVRFTIVDSDAAGLTLRLRAGRTLTGTLGGEDAGGPPFDPAGIRVTALVADPADHALAPRESAKIDGRLGFSLPGVLAPVVIRLQGLPSGWFLRAVLAGRGDVVDEPIDGLGTGRRIRLVVSNRGATLVGTLEDAAGRPAALRDVRLYPDGDDAPPTWASRLRRALTDRAGHFQIEAIAPGAYIVLAADRPIPMPIDADAWSEIKKLGTAVSLDGQARESLTLTLVEWPY